METKARDYFHLGYPPTSGWVIRLVNVLLNSRPEVQERLARWWQREEVYEKALALASKLEMLRIVTRRLDERLRDLGEELLGRSDDVLACLEENSACPIRQDDLLWEALVDLDAFLFEARSAYEILGALLATCFGFIFEKKLREEDVWEAIRGQGVDTEWIEVLRSHRILFFHTTAPWLAVRVTARNPLKIDWLVLKRNRKDLDNMTDYLEFDDCRSIYRGLNKTLLAIEYWLEDEIEKLQERM